MSVNSEIERLLTAKAYLKTAIEGKGVSVPASTKLGGYSALVDSIETAPYIVNPLNGGRFGPPIDGQDGTFTHQYQVSSGTIIDASLWSTISTDVRNGFIGSGGGYNPTIEGYGRLVWEQYGMTVQLDITNSGLLTATFTSTENDWTTNVRSVLLLLKLNDGTILMDNFECPEAYIDW